mmetsp:Transcript_65198/g.155671  ORF Transcript_65198/g.155671 Transcript_65198/m.155671 type:complete len:657 (-) Transcript_65198:240-2210(-)
MHASIKLLLYAEFGWFLVARSIFQSPEDAPATGGDQIVSHNRLVELNKRVLAADRSHVLVAALMVGTPSQAFRCVLDTATAEFWVPSYHCDSCAGKFSESQNWYHADQSETFEPVLDQQDSNTNSSIPVAMRYRYDEEVMGGYLIKDTVSLGGVEVAHQSLLLVEAAQPSDFEESEDEKRVWDGVCGLGWGNAMSLSEPFYMGLKKAGLQPVFVLFPPDPMHPDGPGFMAIAQVPLPRDAIERISWSPHLPGTEQWMVQASAITLLDKRAASGAAARFSRVNMVIDTGTDYIVMPREHYETFVNSIMSVLGERLGGEELKLFCPPTPNDVLQCACAVVPYISDVKLDIAIVGAESLQISAGDLWEELAGVDSINGAPKTHSPQCMLLVRAADAVGIGRGESLSDRIHSGAPRRPFNRHPMQGGRSSYSVRDPNSQYGHVPDPVQTRASPAGSADSILAKEVLLAPLPAKPGVECKIELGVQRDGNVKLLDVTAFNQDGETVEAENDACRQLAPPGVNRRLHEEEGRAASGPRRLQSVQASSQGASDVSGNTAIWVIGDVVLRRYVVIFDFEFVRVGFLPVKHIHSKHSDSERYFPHQLALAVAILSCVLAPFAVMALSRSSFGDNPREIRPSGRVAARMQTIHEGDEDEEDPFAAE